MTNNSYQLDPGTWDMTVNAFGNFTVASDPLSVAQDVACAIRTWAGEVWYDTTQGLPYKTDIFGKNPAGSFLRAQIKNAVLTVPSVTAMRVLSLAISPSRTLSGTVLVSSTVSDTPIEVSF